MQAHRAGSAGSLAGLSAATEADAITLSPYCLPYSLISLLSSMPSIGGRQTTESCVNVGTTSSTCCGNAQYRARQRFTASIPSRTRRRNHAHTPRSVSTQVSRSWMATGALRNNGLRSLPVLAVALRTPDHQAGLPHPSLSLPTCVASPSFPGSTTSLK